MEAMDSGPVGCGHSADPHGHPGPVPDQETTQINHALTGTATANDTETNYWGADKAIDGIVNRDETNKQNQSRWSTNGAKTSAMDGLTAGGAPETTDKPETSQKPENTDKPQATEKPENVPQTGDSAQLMVYVAALAAAAVLMGTTVVVRRRHS
ncbi:MAG TPA: hypothetical protein IAD31_09975 [Candidatus Enterenecus faecium]|uniref:Gram-positive cocci surface proteins LPxTG domain-containing protein n=1 Tax=Candidatus Enterenecus faecium TaxID=2840780 RepID=A0A9D0YTX4_9FIRM|nr:hypothetical protein [Candidatus Enterenecus faecium]